MLLPKPKYNIINAMLQKEDLATMEVGELVGEIRAHEMSILGMTEEPTSSKSIALKTKTNKSRKLKMVKQDSSSSNEEDDHHESSSDVEDDGELALMMRKFTRLNEKINKKGFNFDSKKGMFRPMDVKNKICYNCGEKGHIRPNCPKPDKRSKDNKNKHRHDSSDDEEEERKKKNKRFGKKKTHDKKTKLFPKKKGHTKKSFLVEKQEWVTDVSSSEDSSDEEDIVTIALTNEEPPLPPPPMCLMAKGNTKVCEVDSEDDSDEELDPNEFTNLINEYTSVIKREKGKVKILESTHAKLELAHSDLLSKYNDLLKKHNESLVLAKQVEESHKKLKQEHRELAHKYQELEFAYEVIDPSLEKVVHEKVNASTSCDDLLIDAYATNVVPKLASSREKELMDQVASLKSSVEKLSRGEYIHKEILFNNARDYGKRGLGSFPEPNMATTPSPEIKTSFIKEVGSYCQHCQVTGHHTRECTLPSRPLPKLPKSYSSMFQNNHFLLSKVKGKVKAKFIGKIAKESKKKLPKQLWVPKALVTHVQGPKLVWVPKTQK
ncbi:hypothetical protein PAHAL_9G335900 [Panicum hallii]|uniref:CCHC-type domain-containing protein n=1 Tax=Panicum hallii TaxID=206008 RepID=A0A2T8I3E5_9POAL|nr:hypothetical protein PAHAL_9G335900 [Panicum hallii]